MQPALHSEGPARHQVGRLLHTPHTRRFALQGLVPDMALTRVNIDTPPAEPSAPSVQDEAMVVAVTLTRPIERLHWVDGKQREREGARPPGTVTFLDMRRVNQLHLLSPMHSMQFYIPRQAFRLIAGHDLDPAGIGYSRGSSDETLHQLAMAALPAMQRPDEASTLFLDHMLMGATAHIAAAYAGATVASKGGLTPSQKRRVLDIIDARLDGSVQLANLAAECGLSVRHFTRAFRESLGASPHQWMMQRRIEIAKDLLLHTEFSLSHIALASHFAHQSHLTRTFTAMVGTSPGAWRRQRR